MLLMGADRQQTAMGGIILAVMAKQKTSGKLANPREWHQLKALRKRAKLSQEKLGVELGVTQGFVSQLETGESDYTRSHLEQLSKIFRVDKADLVADGAEGEAVLAILKDLDPPDRARAIEILKALKRTAETR